MPPNSDAATTTTTPDAETPAPGAATTDDYGFPTGDDRDGHSMSDAEMNDFVDKTLGIKPAKGAASEPATTPPATTPQQPATPEPSTPPATPPAPAAAPAATAEPEPAPTAGAEPTTELDTSDLWVEVTNSAGEKVKPTLDDGIPDDFLFANDKQLFEVLDSFQEMKQLRADRETAIEEALQAKADQEANQQTQQATMNGWANEIQDLTDAGLIEAAKANPANGTAYTEAEIAADPGLKLTNDVFKFMSEENNKRVAAGKAPLTSFTAAFTLFKKDTSTAEAEAEARAKAELVKQRGAIVGGSSAPAGGGKGYVYKRGSAKNIWQVPTDDI